MNPPPTGGGGAAGTPPPTEAWWGADLRDEAIPVVHEAGERHALRHHEVAGDVDHPVLHGALQLLEDGPFLREGGDRGRKPPTAEGTGAMRSHSWEVEVTGGGAPNLYLPTNFQLRRTKKSNNKKPNHKSPTHETPYVEPPLPSCSIYCGTS